MLFTRCLPRFFNDLADFHARLGIRYGLGFTASGLSPDKKRLALLGAQRLGSGEGERKTPLTRQIAFEPLPASVLFGVHGWGPGCRRIHRSPAAIMTTATTPVGKIHFVMLPAVRDKYTSTLSPHRVVNQENQRGGVCFISLDSQVTLFLGRTV